MWKEIFSPSEKKPSKRVYCANCSMDNKLFIHGGNDGSRHTFKSDMWVFDYNTYEWNPIIQMSQNEQELLDLGMHTAVAVLPQWILTRNAGKPYWTSFHKWKFSDNDPLQV
jgi:hypothetical protein